MTIATAPVVLVIFGGTGDLFRRKLAPSLMTLFEEGHLPKHLSIIGTGRSEHTDEEYRVFVAQAISEILGVQATDAFLSRFTYVSGELHELSFYARLQEHIYTFENINNPAAHIVWYCSIAPHFYADIARGISKYTNFLQRPANTNSLLIEKPIGHNTQSCLELNQSIATYFVESQVTRIEHYLTKETLLRLPQFLKEHSDIYACMNGNTVQEVIVYFCETIGVEKRGAFYDSVGALRDVGQNHALEMLAHTCMEYPEELSGETCIRSRVAFLSKLSDALHSESVTGERFQYVGYQSIPGVHPHSKVETAYCVSGNLPEERWRSIPFKLIGGKRVHEKRKCIELIMKDGVLHNSKPLKKITISIDPECVFLTYADASHVVFPFRPNHIPKYQYVEEYARILDAGFKGDQAYSVSAEEVLLLWKITDIYTQLLEQDESKLTIYEPDTNPFTY